MTTRYWESTTNFSLHVYISLNSIDFLELSSWQACTLRSVASSTMISLSKIDTSKAVYLKLWQRNYLWVSVISFTTNKP